MHENRNLFLFLIKINNMHHTRHILPILRTCIWRRCGRCGQCGVSWHRIFNPNWHTGDTVLHTICMSVCLFCAYKLLEIGKP